MTQERKKDTKKQCPAGIAVPTEREQYWRELNTLWEQSGLTQREFCLQRGVPRWGLGWWRSEFKRRDGRRTKGQATEGKAVKKKVQAEPANSFVPVEVITAALPGAAVASLEVVLRGERRIRISGAFDPRVLEQLMEVLERRPC